MTTTDSLTPPRVGILMGSESDRPIMAKAAAVLEELGIPHEVLVRSAHRTPDETAQYAREAAGRGIKVMIAGAGMAAHLAGAIAAHFPLPVIGVPLAAGAMNGTDALFSTVQMPTGVPVATVAINGAANAAHLAAQILAVGDDALAERLAKARQARREALLAG